MHCVTIGRAVSLTLVLSGIFMTNCGMAVEKPREPNDGYLTVRQSLLAMYALGDLTGAAAPVKQRFPFNRINPNVREYARFYLESDNNAAYHIYGAICLLGFVGGEEDISFIEKYVDKSLLGSAETPDHRVLYLRNLALFAGNFAGMMLKRDIDTAELFLKKYAKVSSWMAPGQEATPWNLSNAKEFYSDFLVGAYQYSKADDLLPLLQEQSPDGKPYVRESLVDSLRNMDMDMYTEFMNQKAVPEKELNEVIARSLERHGEWIDMLMKKQTYAQWREAREKEKATGQAAKEPGESFESIDMSETVVGRHVKAIAREAVGAFEQVSATLLNRDAGEAPVKKEVLQDIRKAGLHDYEDFHVTIEVEAAVEDSIPAVAGARNAGSGPTQPTLITKKKAAAVTFRIRGTGDTFKRHVPEVGPNAPVSQTTGDVIIQMRRANDAWYWGSESGPRAGAVADITDDEYLIESVREGTTAYAQIATALIEGDYDPLTIPVIDNGELILLEKRRKDADEMAEALDIERRILAELMKAELNAYGDHRIKVRVEAVLGDGEPSGETDVTALAVRGYETADVRFAILNAAEAYRKHAPKRSGYDTLDDAGNLRVWMKRINGKWYWNPFGW